MKRVPLLLAGALAATAIVAAPSRPVAAQGVEYDGTCGKVIPVEAIKDWTFSSLDENGTLASRTAPYIVPAGGAGVLTTATTVAGYGTAAVGTFLMSMGASCLVGDYVGFDSAVSTTVAGVADFASGLFGRADPSSLSVSGINAWTPVASTPCGTASAPPGKTPNCTYVNTNGYVDFVVGPDSLSTTATYTGRTYDSSAARTIDVVNIPATEVDAWHTPTVSRTTRAQGQSHPSNGYVYGFRAMGTGGGSDVMTERYASVAYGSNLTTKGVGDVFGVPPGEYYYQVDIGATPDAVVGFFHTAASITAETFGWRRVHTVDLQCWNGTGLDWRRVVSPPWWEAQPTERVPIVRCPNGQIPLKYVISAPPTNVTLPALGTSWKWTTEVMQAPAGWESNVMEDWAICLTSNTDCGTPETEFDVDGITEICVWGVGGQIGTGACGPNLSPETTPEIAPRVRGTQTVTVAPEPTVIGEPTVVTTQPTTSETDPPDEPGTGTDIVVPINPGTGMGNPIDGEGCIGGWSWFNPIEWVLEPVKCALLWAFVPDSATLATAFDDFQTELFAQFPFSLIALAVDFLDTLGDELSSASGSGCFGFGGSWSFGSAGSVAADDVCIGDDVTVSVGQRAVLLAIIGAPMVFGLLRHAWGMVLGGSKREAET